MPQSSLFNRRQSLSYAESSNDIVNNEYFTCKDILCPTHNLALVTTQWSRISCGPFLKPLYQQTSITWGLAQALVDHQDI